MSFEDKNYEGSHLSDQEKYLRVKEAITRICFNSADAFNRLNENRPLVEACLADISIMLRNSLIDTQFPFRIKSYKSLLVNLRKLASSLIYKISDETFYNENDINEVVDQITYAITKDFFAATIVANMRNDNDIKNYWKAHRDTDPEIVKFYNQIQVVEKYLSSSDDQSETDISLSFIDDEEKDERIPTVLPPLNTNVSTLKEYYEQLIGLLTICKNSSPIYSDKKDLSEFHKKELPNAKIRRGVAQSDISYLKLVAQAELYNPKSYEDWIALLTILANNTYFLNDEGIYKDRNGNEKTLHEQIQDMVKLYPASKNILQRFEKEHFFIPNDPFDVQLDKALKEFELAINDPNFDIEKGFRSDTEKLIFTNRLEHLKTNLEKMYKGRILHYISTTEVRKILEKLSNVSPEIEIKIIRDEDRCKLNGFNAHYFEFSINGITAEIQVQDEFGYRLAAEGPCCHHTSICGKCIDLFQFIELANSAKQDPHFSSNEASLDFYFNFLSSVNVNNLYSYDVSTDKISREDNERLDFLKKLTEFASEKIQPKEFIEEEHSESIYDESTGTYSTETFTVKTPFSEYLIHLAENNGSIFFAIYPTHGIQSNQAFSVNYDLQYLLENLLKGRRGTTFISRMIIDSLDGYPGQTLGNKFYVRGAHDGENMLNAFNALKNIEQESGNPNRD